MLIGIDNIAAAVVTFNPNIYKLEENICNILDQVDHIFIFDNGSNEIEEVRRIASIYDCKVDLIESLENKGIAYALNRLCKKAIENGYKWILTLDQDSVCPSNLIEKLLFYANDDVAVIGPQIIYMGNEQFTKKVNCECERVEWLITSASLTNLNVFKEINGFDEWLFIDWVDYDYCIRAGRAGYKVLKVNDVQLLHELGRLKCINFLGKVVYVTNHASFRYFYMVRNSLYLTRKLNVNNYCFLFKLFVKVLIWEPNKLSKLEAMLHGMISYYKHVFFSRERSFSTKEW